MKWLIVTMLGCLVTGCAKDEPGLMAQWDAAAGAEPPVGGIIDQDAEQGAPVPNVAAPAGAREEKLNKIPITKREARLVDKKRAMAENPSIVEVENKINASDPLTAVAQSYFTIGSKAQVAAMQHNLRIQKELNNGNWPSFEEFEKSLKQAGVKLSALYAYQMYGYDQETGGIVVLEDRAEKKRQYEAAGRDYPHDD